MLRRSGVQPAASTMPFTSHRCRASAALHETHAHAGQWVLHSTVPWVPHARFSMPDQNLSLYLRDIRWRVEAVSASINCKIWPTEVPALEVSSLRIARFASFSAA